MSSNKQHSPGLNKYSRFWSSVVFQSKVFYDPKVLLLHNFIFSSKSTATLMPLLYKYLGQTGRRTVKPSMKLSISHQPNSVQISGDLRLRKPSSVATDQSGVRERDGLRSSLHHTANPKRYVIVQKLSYFPK